MSDRLMKKVIDIQGRAKAMKCREVGIGIGCELGKAIPVQS